eukprot:3760420-Rhodomonas_salina.2
MLSMRRRGGVLTQMLPLPGGGGEGEEGIASPLVPYQDRISRLLCAVLRQRMASTPCAIWDMSSMWLLHARWSVRDVGD